MIFTGCNKIYRTKSFLNIPYFLLSDYSLKKRNGDAEADDSVPIYKYNCRSIANVQYSWGMEFVDDDILTFVAFDQKLHDIRENLLHSKKKMDDDIPTEFTITSKMITR